MNHIAWKNVLSNMFANYAISGEIFYRKTWGGNNYPILPAFYILVLILESKNYWLYQFKMHLTTNEWQECNIACNKRWKHFEEGIKVQFGGQCIQLDFPPANFLFMEIWKWNISANYRVAWAHMMEFDIQNKK